MIRRRNGTGRVEGGVFADVFKRLNHDGRRTAQEELACEADRLLRGSFESSCGAS